MTVLQRKAWWLAVMASVVLAGCTGSSPARYYTLQPPVSSVSAAPRVDYQIEVASVTIPEQIDQPQIMLRPVQGGGPLEAIYSDRWSAPLADEIRIALTDTLVNTLGALDVRVLEPAPNVPVWRIQVDVQRFDMVAGGPASLEATWRVRPLKVEGSRALICRSLVQLPADRVDVVGSLVQAQQQALVLLAKTIASSIQSGGVKATPADQSVQMLGCT
jgi:uncharacterized lipoprotein YmbA